MLFGFCLLGWKLGGGGGDGAGGEHFHGNRNWGTGAQIIRLLVLRGSLGFGAKRLGGENKKLINKQKKEHA